MNNYPTPFFNPYGFMGQYQQPQTPVQPSTQVVRVNGENGARAFQMGANSSALLLDESGQIIWLKTTDGAGFPTITPYDIVPHKAEPQPDFGNLESRIQRLEEIVNAKPVSPTRKKQSDDGAD